MVNGISSDLAQSDRIKRFPLCQCSIYFLNPRPLSYESSTLTTRPRLCSLTNVVYYHYYHLVDAVSNVVLSSIEISQLSRQTFDNLGTNCDNKNSYAVLLALEFHRI